MSGGTALIVRGDARHLPLSDQYVQCVVTSPPYWGLRDYKLEPLTWEDGWRGSLGLEPTPDLYVQHLVGIFREVRRVLKDDGTVWLNLGDSYCNAGSARQGEGLDGKRRGGADGPDGATGYKRKDPRHALGALGIKHKDLVGIPWMVAFALRADGWYLRSDIIWAKGYSFHPTTAGSCMPESVTDRPTRGHEYVFLLTKSAKYYYDAEAVKEQGIFPAGTRAAKGSGTREGNRRQPPKQDALGKRTYTGFNERYFAPDADGYATYSGTRNLRSVWLINPKPFREAHFATFPPALVEPCVKAGSASYDQDPSRSVVLDPFGGAGTVGLVADRLRRFAVCLDPQPDYCQLARRRLRLPHADQGRVQA